MKIFSRILSLLVLASLGLLYTGCGGGGGSTDPVQKIQLAQLSKAWSIDSAPTGATLNTNDRTADFTNFKLTIGGTFNSTTPNGPYTFTTSGATTMPSPSPWSPSGGSWSFSSVDSDGKGGNIVTGDGIGITYKFTSTGLKLSFNCEACTYNARATEVNGDWIFNLH